MPRPHWDKPDDFLNVEDFAVIARSDDGRELKVILEEQYLSRDLSTYDVALPAPWITGKESDMRDLKKRDRLLIEGVVYWLLHDAEPDGTGFASAKLSRTAQG